MNQSQKDDPRFWKRWMNSGSVKLDPVVRERNGQLVLEDSSAAAFVHAVEKINYRDVLDLNAERVEYFKNRMAEKNLTANDFVIVLLNVDDSYGGPIADILMPDFDWQEIRDRGEVPYARGFADRKFVQEILILFDEAASKKLQAMSAVAVVVVDHGVAEVFAA